MTARQPLLIEIIDGGPATDRLGHRYMGWYLQINGAEYGRSVSPYVPGDLVSEARAYERTVRNVEQHFKPKFGRPPLKLGDVVERDGKRYKVEENLNRPGNWWLVETPDPATLHALLTERIRAAVDGGDTKSARDWTQVLGQLRGIGEIA